MAGASWRPSATSTCSCCTKRASRRLSSRSPASGSSTSCGISTSRWATASRDLLACEALAEQDHTARTALLDLRLLGGDAALYRELEREQLHGLSQTRVEGFITDKIAEVRGRRERFGDSLYLLEPNVKESEGGLRDLQSALWIARARWKVAGVTELLSRAILPEREIGDLRRARDFLWRVRNEMHYLAGRKWDQLTFDVQPQVAQFMGYADGQTPAPSSSSCGTTTSGPRWC